MRLNLSRIEGAALIMVGAMGLSLGCSDPPESTSINGPAEASLDHGDPATYSVGSESYTLSDLRTVYDWMLGAPDILQCRVEIEGDLKPERLLRLVGTHGREHTEPAQEHAEYVLPALDLHAAIESPDPWVVSAALFLARKQQVDLDLDTLVDRWQSEQPWDEVCNEQVILYLAGRSSQDLDRLPPGLVALERADPDQVEIRPWLFLLSAEWAPDLMLLEPDSGLVLEVRDSTMDVISERPLAPGESDLVLPATSNYYSFRYLNGRMHGESRFVDGKPGTFIRMAIAVNGGV
jgi:hypothetical protein